MLTLIYRWLERMGGEEGNAPLIPYRYTERIKIWLYNFIY